MQGEKKKGGEILEEDFTFAYEKFLMDCTLGSKINLIIRAEEINIKKKFFERLKKKCGAEEAKILLENAGEAADAFYLFFQNKYAAQMQNLYDKAGEEWINSSGQH